MLTTELGKRRSVETRMNVDVARVAQHADRKAYDDFISAIEFRPTNKQQVESPPIIPGLRYD